MALASRRKFRRTCVHVAAPDETERLFEAVLELRSWARGSRSTRPTRAHTPRSAAPTSLTAGGVAFTETDGGFVPPLVRKGTDGEGSGLALLPRRASRARGGADGVLLDASVARELMEAGAPELAEALCDSAVAVDGVGLGGAAGAGAGARA